MPNKLANTKSYSDRCFFPKLLLIWLRKRGNRRRTKTRIKGKRLRMDDNDTVFDIITGSSYEEQSSISITLDNISKNVGFHSNALKSLIEGGLFSDSASRD